MAKHPMVQQQIYEEVTHVLGGRVPTADDIPQLPLIKGLVKETLRLDLISHSFHLSNGKGFLLLPIEYVNAFVLCIDCRLYPVLPGNGRITQDNLIVGGYFIPKGVHLCSPCYCTELSLV